jgi:type VI protein secretion system component VasA
MKKQDYLTLAHTLRADIEALHKQRDAQIMHGLKTETTGEALEATMVATRNLEQRINYIRLLARGLSMKLAVDRKAFLTECGIFPGSVFD